MTAPEESQAAMDLQAPDSALAPVTNAPLARVAPTIDDIIATAVHEKLPAAELKELIACRREMQADQARQEFYAAKADFKAKCPPIPRTRRANFATSDGRLTYDYASLEDIAAVVDPVLNALGLSYDWPDSTENGGKITVRCCLRHRNGHSESATFVVPVSSRAGMSDQQKYASASTYARRYALVAVLGITTVDHDDDGRSDGPAATITKKQALQVEDLLSNLHDVDANPKLRGLFLERFGVEKIAELPASKFKEACGAVQAKIDGAK